MDFPTSPVVGTIISFPGGQSYRWSGTVWDTVNPGLRDPYPFPGIDMQLHGTLPNLLAVNDKVGGNGTDVTTIDKVGNFQTSGNVSAGQQVYSLQNFVSTTTTAIFAATGAGSVFLRPNGAGSGTGQASLANSGAFNVPSISTTGLNVTGTSNDPIAFGITSGSYCRASYTVGGLRSWKAGVSSDAKFSISDESGASIILAIAQVGGGSTILQGGFQITGSAWKPGGGAWADSSDERIKNVVGPYSRGLEDVKALNPILYTFKGNDTNEEPNNGYNPAAASGEAEIEEEDIPTVPYANSPHYQAALDAKQFIGLVAQEVEQVFPGMVTKRAAFIDGEPVTDLRDLDATTLIFALVNAVKELAAKVEALETA